MGIYNVYNPIDQRIQKNSGNAKTYFAYDEQGKLIGEYDAGGNAVREYVYLGNQPIAMLSNQKDGEVLQIHTDHLGTPRAVTDKDNNVLWRMEGDQFGNVQPQVEHIKLPLRHAGQYHDSETGLFYNWHRFYNPSTGRYVTSDPLGLTDGTNPYIYVHNNPLAYVDPDGQFAFLALAPVIGGSIGISGATAVNIVGASIATGLGIAILDKAIDKADENTCDRDDDPCKHLNDKIDAAWKYLRRLNRNEKKNKGKKGGSLGHLQSSNQTKKYLKNLLDEAERLGCSIDPRAYIFLEREYPWSPP